MNERLKELAQQAGMEVDLFTGGFDVWFSDGHYIDVIKRFADLVRQNEREANVKLLEDFAKTNMVPAKDTWRMGVMAAANAVRDKK